MQFKADLNKQMCGFLCVVAAVFAGSGCLKAPIELQKAVQKQQEEIQQVRLFYNDAIEKLFREIEDLQIHYIDQFERALIAKYKFKRGENPGTVAPDDDLNVILVPIQGRIHNFAEERRAKVRENVSLMKKQYLALNQSIENIDTINRDLGAYIDSLIRYRKAQDALGETLAQKVQGIVPTKLPSLDAIGSLLKTFESEFAKAAQP